MTRSARQLERARLAARSAVVGTLVDVSPVVTALARTMQKLHRDRDIAIALDVPAHARFRGEQQDLEEMVGNLVGMPANGRSRALRSRSPQMAPRGAATAVCASSLTMTDRDFQRPSASRSDRAVGGLMRPSRAPALGCQLSSSLRALMGALTLGTAPIGGLRAELALPAG